MEKKKFTSSIWFTAGVSILVGVIIYMIPIPQSLHEIAELVPARNAERAWTMFAIFMGTIVALILKPWPMGTVALIAITLLIVTRTLGVGAALAGFGNSVMWLIICAFFISRGFVKTRLGERIAYIFMKRFGKKTLGLTYSLIASDFVISPAMASSTARLGGVIYPIIRSLTEVYDSKPENGTERRLGSYLLFTTFQADMPVSAMFLTAMAANPLAMSIARDIIGIEVTWVQWMIAALLPGLVTIVVVPLILYKLYAPEIKETPKAAEIASEKLAEMGPLTMIEKKLIGIFIMVLVLWIFGGNFGIDATTGAFIGLCTMLISEVLTYEDIKSEKNAWDTLLWWATLVMMAGQLNTLGIIPWFSEIVTNAVYGVNWVLAFVLISLAYYYSHYFFASNTAHVSAMYGALLVVSVAVGTPPLVAALVLAFFSSLFGGLTHYGTGSAPVIFGSGYIKQNHWFGYAFIISVVFIVIWLGIGGLWWRLLGLW